MSRNVVRALEDVVANKLIILLSPFHLLFSQKVFAYNFEFLHAFLSYKKIRFSHTQDGGAPPFTHQIVISGWTAGM